jgi:hypothetical protein
VRSGSISSQLCSSWNSFMPQLSETGASLKEYLLKEFDQLMQKRG